MSVGEGGGSDDGAQRSWRTNLILVLAAIAVVHSALIALWLAPSGPVREAAGGTSTLARYVDPYFRQAWDVMDPSSQRVDEALWVRAKVRAGENRVTQTEWLDVTKVDLAATHRDVAPARIHLAGRRLAANLNSTLFGLEPAGRQVAAESFAGRSDELSGALSKAGTPGSAVKAYIDVDTMTTRFATLYTQAYATERVVQVQYRVGRRVVAPHTERGGDRVTDTPFAWFETGWRSAVRGSAEAQAAFDDLAVTP